MPTWAAPISGDRVHYAQCNGGASRPNALLPSLFRYPARKQGGDCGTCLLERTVSANCTRSSFPIFAIMMVVHCMEQMARRHLNIGEVFRQAKGQAQSTVEDLRTHTSLHLDATRKAYANVKV